MGKHYDYITMPYDLDQVMLYDEPLEKSKETGHIAFLGGPKSGKTMTIANAMKVARNRSEQAFVVDFNAELSSRLYDPEKGDILLSAHNPKSSSWSPLAEIENPNDCDRIARAMTGCGGNAKLDSYEQTVTTYVSACLLACWYLYQQGETVTNGTLTKYLGASSGPDLLNIVGTNHPVAPLFDKDNERLFARTQAAASMMGKEILSTDELAGFDAFSINRHVADEQNDAFIFASPLLEAGSTATGLAAMQAEIYLDAVSQLSKANQRRWLLIDELGNLPPMFSLTPGLIIAGKNGLAAMATAQNLPQIKMNYGDDKAKTLLSHFKTKMFLYITDKETQEYAQERGVGSFA